VCADLASCGLGSTQAVSVTTVSLKVVCANVVLHIVNYLYHLTFISYAECLKCGVYYVIGSMVIDTMNVKPYCRALAYLSTVRACNQHGQENSASKIKYRLKYKIKFLPCISMPYLCVSLTPWTIGSRAFSVASWTVWNSMPDSSCDLAVECKRFRRDFKLHLFAGH